MLRLASFVVEWLLKGVCVFAPFPTPTFRKVKNDVLLDDKLPEQGQQRHHHQQHYSYGSLSDVMQEEEEASDKGWAGESTSFPMGSQQQIHTHFTGSSVRGVYTEPRRQKRFANVTFPSLPTSRSRHRLNRKLPVRAQGLARDNLSESNS